MKSSTKGIMAVLVAIWGIIQIPAVQQAAAGGVQALVGSHPTLASALAVVSTILALVHNPKA